METKDFLQVPQVKLTYSDPASKRRPQISCSSDSQKLIGPFFEDCMQHHEEIYALLLSTRHRVIGVVKLGEGSLAGTTINRSALFQALILSNAKSCILVHNHPSGNLVPSIQDDGLTKEIKSATQLLGFGLLDHIILAEDEYYSYADEGRL